MTETENVTWLTQEAYDRLTNELEYLEGEGRTSVAKTIEAARAEGDLKENGGYHAAREEQAKQEARIRQLQELLRNVKVGEAPSESGIVQPGMVVTVELGGDEMVFLLGSREAAGTTDVDVYSERSPLGAAIVGLAPGESGSYTAPNGREVTVTVIDAKPFVG